MPDWSRGDTIEGKEDAAAWLATFPWEGKVKNDMEALIKFIKEIKQVNGKIGSMGFCWGAWAFCKAS